MRFLPSRIPTNFHKKSLNGKFDNKKEERKRPLPESDISLCPENLKTHFLLIEDLKTTFEISVNKNASLS